MGNCCGKPESSDNFRSQGRVLGSAPPRETTAPVPPAARSANKQPAKIGGPPRTLGGGEGSSSSQSSTGPEDAKRKAALAAEARAKGKPAGKLASQLEAQKKKTMNETLKDASDETRRLREIDSQAQTLSHS